MTKKQAIQLFQDSKIRTAWDDKEEGNETVTNFHALKMRAAESPNPQTYWRVLKSRLKKGGNETVTNCNALKMRAADSPNPQTYWRVLKSRLKKEGNETVTNCHQLKMRAADGKMRLTEALSQMPRRVTFC